MSIQIYWGAPGSYKTSSMTEREMVKYALAGRPIITNVRGASLELIFNEYGKGATPNPSQLFFNVGSTANPDTLRRLQYFFNWAPKGTVFLIDEAQIVFPDKGLDLHKVLASDFCHDDITYDFYQRYDDKQWVSDNVGNLNELFLLDGTQTDIEERQQNYLEFIKECLARPTDLRIAFDMHRHHGWDFVFTMPNIKKINPAIRELAEGAYFHKNLARVSLKGRFSRFSHDPTVTSPRQNDFYVTESRLKINKRTFRCYRSTTTGEVKDTEIRLNPLKDGRIQFALFLWLVIIVGFFTLGSPIDTVWKIIDRQGYLEAQQEETQTQTQNLDAPPQTPEPVAGANTAQVAQMDEQKAVSPVSVPGRDLAHRQDRRAGTDDALNELSFSYLHETHHLFVEGYLSIGYEDNFLVRLQPKDNPEHVFYVNYPDLNRMGYTILKESRNLYAVYFSERGSNVSVFLTYTSKYIEPPKEGLSSNFASLQH